MIYSALYHLKIKKKKLLETFPFHQLAAPKLLQLNSKGRTYIALVLVTQFVFDFPLFIVHTSPTPEMKSIKSHGHAQCSRIHGAITELSAK